jgi:hypothetical protein
MDLMVLLELIRGNALKNLKSKFGILAIFTKENVIFVNRLKIPFDGLLSQ